MVLLEKEVNGIALKTEFEFDDKHIELVKSVLNCLKGKTVGVPIGNEANEVIPISILEWLPVVCRRIMFDGSGGSYITFFNPTIMAHAMRLLLRANKPIAVDMFVGEIKVSRDVRNYNDAFCYVLVHEMQHAINALKYAYPALTNWKGFLFNIINVNELLNAEDFDPTIDRLTELDKIQDEAPIEEGLKPLEETFGSPIHTWFRGYSKFVKDVIMKPCLKNP